MARGTRSLANPIKRRFMIWHAPFASVLNIHATPVDRAPDATEEYIKTRKYFCV